MIDFRGSSGGTLDIKQFRYGEDNLAYLIYGNKQAMAVDGGAWFEMLQFLNRYGLTLKIVTNTHGHYDHTSGNSELLRQTKAIYLDSKDLRDFQEILIEDKKVVVYRTPGHTNDSVCFHAGHYLITGDTLFIGTIGNCFSGNPASFYQSLRRLMALPCDTIIYPGHDYVQDALAFAHRLEPDNSEIATYLNHYDPDLIRTTLANESRINPYLRFNEDAIVVLLQKLGLPHATEWERWKSLMSID